MNAEMEWCCADSCVPSCWPDQTGRREQDKIAARWSRFLRWAAEPEQAGLLARTHMHELVSYASTSNVSTSQWCTVAWAHVHAHLCMTVWASFSPPPQGKTPKSERALVQGWMSTLGRGKARAAAQRLARVQAAYSKATAQKRKDEERRRQEVWCMSVCVCVGARARARPCLHVLAYVCVCACACKRMCGCMCGCTALTNGAALLSGC